MSIIAKSITEQIYDIIKEKILLQEYKVGSKIDMNEIAEEHDISIMPVRDALNKLSHQGLVLNKSRVGFYVRKYSKEEIKNIMELRIMFETYCLKKHFNNIDKSKIRNIYVKTQTQESNQREIFDKIDADLHYQFIKSSNNNFLINEYNKIYDQIVLFKHLDEKRIELANNEHCRLIESILNDHKEQAAKNLELHIENVKNSIIEKIQ